MSPARRSSISPNRPTRQRPQRLHCAADIDRQTGVRRIRHLIESSADINRNVETNLRHLRFQGQGVSKGNAVIGAERDEIGARVTGGDLDSGIGTLLITDIPEDIAASEARLDTSGRLVVVWGHDGHRSCFEPQWLRDHCYSLTERERRRHRPRLWDSSLNPALPAFDYQRMMEDDSVRLEVFEQVRDLGFSRVRRAPTTSRCLQDFAGLFGRILTFDLIAPLADLKTSPDEALITDTPMGIPKHTDVCYRHAPSGIQFFQGVKASGGGGETVLGDGFKIASVLRDTEPEAFELLTTVPLQFYRYVKGLAAYYSEGLAISLDSRREVLGFRYGNRVTAAPLDLPGELVEPAHNALRKLVALMNDPDLEVRFLLEPGDIVIFDNQRVLHGRTAYDEFMGERHLRRCEVTREGVPQPPPTAPDRPRQPRAPQSGSEPRRPRMTPPTKKGSERFIFDQLYKNKSL